MHHDHERAKVRVRSTVGGTRIVNKMTAVINIRDRCRTGFVCPETVATLAIPVKVPIWPNHQCDKMSFFRTLVIRRWTVDKAVGFRSRSNGGTCKIGVHRSCGLSGLCEGVTTIIGAVVIAVIVQLLLSAIVPPIRLIERGTSASLEMPFMPRKRPCGKLQTNLSKAVDLLLNKAGRPLPDWQTSNWPRAAADKILEIWIGRTMRQAHTKEIAVDQLKTFRQSPLLALDKIDRQASIPEGVGNVGNFASSRFNWRSGSRRAAASWASLPSR